MQRPPFRFAALAAAATVVLSISGCDRAIATSTTQSALHAAASASLLIDDARAVARRELAVQALLTNLLDDADPPRFADPDQPLVCGSGSTVHVDGAPLEPGAELPAASFTLELQLAGACPLGIAGPRLSGPMTMVVVRDDEAGLVPVVLAQH